MKVALYARVSDPSQDPENQLQRLRALATARGAEVFREYVEVVSGANDNKPIQAQMIRDARAQRFKAIWVVRLDRFGRSAKGLLNLFDELEQAHCTFDAVEQGIDSSTAAGRFMRTILAAVAELERELIVERVKDGLAKSRAAGRRPGPALRGCPLCTAKEPLKRLLMRGGRRFRVCQGCYENPPIAAQVRNGRKPGATGPPDYVT